MQYAVGHSLIWFGLDRSAGRFVAFAVRSGIRVGLVLVYNTIHGVGRDGRVWPVCLLARFFSWSVACLLSLPALLFALVVHFAVFKLGLACGCFVRSLCDVGG